ncbi:single-stranded-DNA-specific exonuclease RecJ [Jeotgalibacillus soli]|uniref:Single-stranded-DNA-specific exonuclease RecJ n=1 Tax=Jeotgalibacillus soli TaxID=889306 RepID=A0A0C2RS12_9BACL|nr:single-stranded-DNA-specific exonuclease RecJ [Jeotgalibacillus soli]KIL44524.1 recombination protein RecJ [Jeotgalibacillus soli]
MLQPKTRWMVKPSDEQKIQNLIAGLQIPKIVATLLVQRGMDQIDSARSFLQIENEDFHDPFLLLDMDKAVHRIKQAIENEEMILVYGDYDADGVTSTSVILSTLQRLGANVEFYIPNRFTEGYGPNEEAFRFAVEQGTSLIITVDNGISSIHEAAVMRELGVDLIVTDHHEPGPELPDAFAIIHPNHPNGDYPFRELAGVGVAFKLAHALLGKAPLDLLDLVAIGTIADLVPLQGENRLLVKKGLKVLRQTTRTGIHALCKIAGSAVAELDEEGVGFVLGPRINAVGRLSDADPAVELMMTADPEEAEALAIEIDAMNKERQAIVSSITEEAIAKVESTFSPNENRVLVLVKEGWNPGVVGIVASRLVDRYYRPVIILCSDPITGKTKGSARSIAGFNMFEELSECRDILPHFGGHPMAAGMTLLTEDVDELRNRLNEQALKMSPEDFIPVTNVDTVTMLEDVDLDAIIQVQMLAPFGMKNPKPKVVIEEASIASIRKIGANQNHLKITLEQNQFTLDGIGFHLGEIADHLSPIARVDVLGELSVNEWNNTRKPQLFIKDIKVKHWQLFDVRGIRQPKRWLASLPPQKEFIAFHTSTMEYFEQETAPDRILFIENAEQAKKHSIENKNIVLLDLPNDVEALTSLLSKEQPNRIYAHFYQQDPQFFTTIPTREHFGWYYGFLLKRSEFDLRKNGDALANHKGWTRETINFMSKVFFELEFVRIKDGVIIMNESVQKRDLSHSPAYQAKQKLSEMEQDLLYSSFQQLKTWFDQHAKWSKRLEEEKVWI